MKSIATRYGLGLALSLIAFFLIMHFIGLSQKYDFRLFNAVIHIAFIYLGIRKYFNETEGKDFNYVAGVAQGMYLSLVGVLIFAAFMTAFMVAEPQFLDLLKENKNLGKYLNPFTASVFLVVEGIATSLILSYIVTRIIEYRNRGAYTFKEEAG